MRSLTLLILILTTQHVSAQYLPRAAPGYQWVEVTRQSNPTAYVPGRRSSPSISTYGTPCPKCGGYHNTGTRSQGTRYSSRFRNDFNYSRRIDGSLQSKANWEANQLARQHDRYGFQGMQNRWTSSNGRLGHLVTWPSYYIGGTGCSEPGGGGYIYTCEPPSGNYILVAEATAVARDGTIYASRCWAPSRP